MNEILVNGERLETAADAASIQALSEAVVRSRGLAYGEGMFETIAVVEGRPLLWRAHMQRLCDGAQRLGLAEPDVDVLEHEALSLCANQDRAVVKILWVAESGGRGYTRSEVDNKEGVPAIRILSCQRWPLTGPLTGPSTTPSKAPSTDIGTSSELSGAVLCVCETRLAEQPLLAGLKHLNRLEQVLAAREVRPPANEGLLLSTNGSVIEGVRSNVFIVKDGRLFTPGLGLCGVAGVVRGWIVEQAKLDAKSGLGPELRVTELSLQDCLAADEVFITNSVMGIQSVSAIEDQSFQRGPLTEQWQSRYQTQVVQPAIS